MKILIVEDDTYYNSALTRYIHTVCNENNYPDIEFEINSYYSAQECLENLEDDTNLMILDYFLINEDEPETFNGADIIREVKKNNPECQFIIISEQQNPSVASQLMRMGVIEYIDKNISNRNRLGFVLQKLLRNEVQIQKL